MIIAILQFVHSTFRKLESVFHTLHFSCLLFLYFAFLFSNERGSGICRRGEKEIVGGWFFSNL